MELVEQKSLFTHWKECFTENFANFNGRARRREYWGFVLFNILVSIPLYAFQFILTAAFGESGNIFGALLNGIFSLAVLVPNLAVGIRRLHDIGKSGWWLLLALIPFIGGIILLVFTCLDSQVGENQYGENPKGVSLN